MLIAIHARNTSTDFSQKKPAWRHVGAIINQKKQNYGVFKDTRVSYTY